MTNKLPVVGKRYRSKISANKNIYRLEEIVNNQLNKYVIMSLNNSSTRQEFDLDVFDKIFEELPEDNQDISKKETTLSKEVLEAMEELRKQIKETSWNVDYIAVDKNKIKTIIEALDNIKTQAEPVVGYEIETETFFDECDDKKSLANQTKQENSNTCIEECTRKIEANENGNFKHIENAEEISQDIMKESIWKPVSELPDQTNRSRIIVETMSEEMLLYHTQDGVIYDLEMNEISLLSFKRFALLTDFINQHNSLLDRVERLEKIIHFSKKCIEKA